MKSFRLAEVLDVRAIFPRVSAVASRILPHDHLTMSFHDGEGHVVVEAASNDDFPSFDRVTVDDSCLRALNEPFFIAADFLKEPLPIQDPRDLNERIVSMGYRSLLRVHLRARDERIGITFWSKRPHAFTTDDVSAARRVAEHVAL